MSNVAELYAQQLKKHFKILFANWEPGTPLRLGDYGILVGGNIFVPQGNLQADFTEFSGDAIKTVTDSTKDQKEFKSESGVEVSFNAKGSLNPQGVELAKASLEIKFSSESSVFFNAAECETIRIANKVEVGDKLRQLLKNRKWDKRYCVVTDLVLSGKTIVAISQSKDSSISFEAESPEIEKINLGDASLKLNLTSNKDIGYKVDAKDGLVVLIGLSKIKNPFPWWTKDRFDQKKAFYMTHQMMHVVEDELDAEENIDELIFSQLGMED